MEHHRAPIPDETGQIVQARFQEFLMKFAIEGENELTQKRLAIIIFFILIFV